MRRPSSPPARAALLAAACAFVLASPSACAAQQQAGEPLEVGAIAPDFELPGATRYGTLAEPVRLSDYRGEVIVLAFFYRARTKG